MPPKRRLLRGETTYSAAIESERDVLLKLTYPAKRDEFFTLVNRYRADVEAIVAHHLGLRSPKRCHVTDVEEWIHGSFNVCVPVRIEGHPRRVIVRFPLPYRVGEGAFPGNADEKLRCEAGAYVWLQQECPSIPIPYLHGFGLSNGQHYTLTKNLPLWTRWVQRLRRILLWIRRSQLPSHYVSYRTQALRNPFGPYLVIDYIEESEGRMLSETWDDYREDKEHLANLLHGLSHLTLTLSHIPLPKIGSFIVDDDGFLQLANRPLTSTLQELENAGLPMHIMRDHTYTSVISYINDLLTYHDNRLRHQQNATKSVGDCVEQMCAHMVMRAVGPQFYDHSLDSGPFAFCLTDLHQSNIFVDEDWNVTHIIDLEWAASLPLEFMQPPHWLSGQEVDVVNVEAYNPLREEFMDMVKEKEKQMRGDERLSIRPLSCIMESGWKHGTFWYNLALRRPLAMHSIFYNRIQSRFAENHRKDEKFYEIVGFYWCREVRSFIRTKLDQKEEYDKQLKEAFAIVD